MLRRICSLVTAVFCAVAVAALSTPEAHAAVVEAHGRDCASATQLNLDSQATSSLANTDDQAVYKVVLDQRGLFDVWADPNTLDIANMELLNSSCKAITAIHGGMSAVTGNYSALTVPSTDLFGEETVSTLAPGTYFVKINPDRTDVFGDTFTIHTRFTPHYGHECATAEPMALNSSMKGDLRYEDDREVFRIVTTKPGEIHAVAASSANVLPQIALHRADCSIDSALLASNPNNDGGITASKLTPGVYFISVAPAGSKPSGNYVLTVSFSPGDQAGF